ncbi:MAG: substrate-binding domain-containing protein [Solirubrobacterales bacterium]|nr:substrate-binding domain-containing protein [Solirubrobacterales bacterium]
MQGHDSGAPMRWWARRRTWLVGIATLSLALAACGKTSSGSSSSAPAGTTASSNSSSPTAGTSCGTVPSLPIHDSSGVIASLGSTYTTAYNGNADAILPSAFAHFKPKSTGNFTIGVALSQPGNPYNAALLSALSRQLGTVKGVSHVTVLTSSPTQPTVQIQQVNQLIQQGVSVIVTEPIVPPAMVPLAAKAKAAGIPLVAVLNGIPTPDAISVAANSVADGLNMAAGVAKLTGGKGTVIGVHGIPTTGNDKQAFVGFNAVFAKCPNIKLDSSIVGEFSPPLAKQATLTWLSSHPQPVAGAVQAAVMGSGIIQAFEQTGRPQPSLGNIQASAGDLAYWNAHRSTYKSVATTIPPDDIARATAYAVSQILSGHGPKVNEIVSPGALITNSNLSQWVVPGAGPTSQAPVSGPSGSWMPDHFLAPLFNG